MRAAERRAKLETSLSGRNGAYGYTSEFRKNTVSITCALCAQVQRETLRL